MNEETEALAYSQLLLLHADTITDSVVKEMVVNSAAELTILHLRVEALRRESERLRELLTDAKDLAWSFGADSLRYRIDAALRGEEA